MKKTLVMFLSIMFVMTMGLTAFATGETTNTSFSTETVSGNTVLSNNNVTPTVKVSANNPIKSNTAISTTNTMDTQTGGLPTVTIDQASSWGERKGYELVKFLQTVVQPFAIIIFIFCAGLALVGAFGNGQLVGKGLFGMIIAVIMYAVILYAPEILDFILLWLKS